MNPPQTTPTLNRPSLVAVWPGMGNVAINAGYYLLTKLGMRLEAEFEARELFEIDHVAVSSGLIHPGRLPRSRFFAWKDPDGKRDLLLFLGEAQPPTGVYAYCRRIIDHAKELGVERVFTFAAMADEMQLGEESRVFITATDQHAIQEFQGCGLHVMTRGLISGLNGVLPGVAAESGLTGICLLGEMPHLFSQIPYPQASLAVLRAFSQMTGNKLDLTDLEWEAEAMEGKLRSLMTKITEAISQQQDEEGGVPPALEPALQPKKEKASNLSPEQQQHIEDLFRDALTDRFQAYKLKQALDRFNVFPDYEDRFLDLFQDFDPEKPEGT